jgi:hypothetical protein
MKYYAFYKQKVECLDLKARGKYINYYYKLLLN